MPHDPEHQTDILNILENFHGIEPLRKLFWTELNYDHENTALPYQDKNNDLASAPVLWVTGGGDNAFHVIYTQPQLGSAVADSRTPCHLAAPQKSHLRLVHLQQPRPNRVAHCQRQTRCR
jgi:hypothetical protein